MRQKEFTTSKRILARLAPQIILRNAQPNAHIIDLLALNLIRQFQRASHARSLLLHESAELPHAFQESYHGVVEFPVHEGQAERHVAGRVKF